MIFFSILLVFTFAVLVSSTFKITSRPAFVLSVFILAFSNIVFSGLTAGLLNLLNSQTYFITNEFFLALAAILIWLKSGKPAILGPWRNNKELIRNAFLGNNLKKWSAVWVLGILVFLFYVLGILIIFMVPQSTHDSMTTHLARVGFWLQHGNFLPWPTANLSILVYPVNANLVMLWTILFTRTAMLTAFVQWTAALASAAAIFGISRSLNWMRAPSFFAGLLWLTLPQVLLQSTTTQLDLVVGSLFVISIYFLILGIKQRSTYGLILSGLTLGLTLGTKQIAIFALPGLVIFILLVWLKDRHKNFKPILIWVAAALFFTILIGSYIYIQNTIFFGNPLGDKKTLSRQIAGQGRGGTLVENLTFNSARLFYQSIDFSGVPPIFTDNLTGIKSLIFRPLFLSLGLDLESDTSLTRLERPFSYLNNPPIREDLSWYGVFWILLLFPLAVIQFVIGIRQRDPFRIGLVITSITYSLLVVVLRPGWTPYQGRYYSLATALIVPFTASIIRTGRFNRITLWLMVVLSVIIMFNITASNVTKPLLSSTRFQEAIKPLLGRVDSQYSEWINSLIIYTFPNTYDIWDLDIERKESTQNKATTTPEYLIEKYLPENAVIALGTTANIDTFPLFGEQFLHSLFPVYPPEILYDKQWFRINSIEYLILNRNDPLFGNPPIWLIPYQSIGAWGLYYPEWTSPKKNNIYN